MKCFTVWFRRISDLEDFHKAVEAKSRKAVVKWAKSEAQQQNWRVIDVTTGWLQIKAVKRS